MTFDAYARRQAQALFDALTESLVKDLAQAAREEADASAAAARGAAEAAAHAQLAAARTEGEARLAAAQAMNAGLLESVESAREEVREAQAAAEADIERTRAELEARLKESEARVRESDARRKESEARFNENDARLKESDARLKDIDVRLKEADARRKESEARVKENDARLKESDARLKQAEAQLKERDARLKEHDARDGDHHVRLKELQSRFDAQEQALHAARQETGFARIEADACRQDLELIVNRVGAALSAIDRARTPTDILDTLLEPLAQDFAHAAVFLVGPSTVNGWRARGLPATTDVAKLVLPRSGASLIARAVKERKRLFVTATRREPLTGLSGEPVVRAAALPVLAGDQVIAVAYADDTEASTTPFPGVACRIVEMLIDHAMLRLTSKRPAPLRAGSQPAAGTPPSSTAKYSPERQARRLKVQEGIDVTMDGAESDLVDLSSIGAQILSPLALPPNRLVKMTLRTTDNALACKGRVMWARFEQARGSAAARYRVGVKFTDVEPKAVEAFLAQHGIVEATR